MRDLAPLGARDDEKAVPILTTDEGIGQRHLLDSVHSDINGCVQPRTCSSLTHCAFNSMLLQRAAATVMPCTDTRARCS